MKNYPFTKNLFCMLSAWSLSLHPATFVYNLRIAETTKRQAQSLINKNIRPSIAVLTGISQTRETYDLIHENINGVLGTLLYAPNNLFLRVDAAVAHIHAKTPIPVDLEHSRTQCDDILFSAGYLFSPLDRLNITITGMLGIPTHADLALQGVEFGTGHVGLGGQLDAGYAYSHDKQHLLMGATRYVHFMPRTASAYIEQIFVPFDLSPGSIVDILIANYSNWGRHKLEIGYDATFSFGAHIHPLLAGVVDRIDFIRSSLYASYRCLFMLGEHPSGVTIGMSYGIDNMPKDVGFKYIVTLWAGWGINF